MGKQGRSMAKLALVLSLCVLAVAPTWSLESEVVPLSADDVALSDDGTARTEGSDASEASIFAMLDKATGVTHGDSALATRHGELGDMKASKKPAVKKAVKSGKAKGAGKKKAGKKVKKKAAKVKAKKKKVTPKKAAKKGAKKKKKAAPKKAEKAKK